MRMAKVSCSSLTLLLSEKAFCRHVRWCFSFSSFFFFLLALWFLLANSDCEVLPTVHATCGSRVSDYGTLSKLNPNLYLTSILLGRRHTRTGSLSEGVLNEKRARTRSERGHMAEYTTSTKYNIVQCLYSGQNKRVTGALPSRVTAHARSHIHTHTHTLTHKDQPPYVGTRHRCHWVPTEVIVSQHDGGGGDSGGLSKVGVR